MNYIKKIVSFNFSSFGKPRYTLKPKLNAQGNFIEPNWIRKYELKAYVSFTSLRSCINNL